MAEETKFTEEQEAINELQSKFAIINVNGRIWGIEIEQIASDIKTGKPLSFSPRADLNLIMMRYIKRKYPDLKPNKLLKNYFINPDTTCYSGIEFNPKATTNNYLNLWLGLDIAPEEGDWSLIQAFLFDVICSTDHKAYTYLIRFLAHALQRPWEKPGVIILLIGGQGTGKGTIAYICRLIWASAFLQVYDMSTVTGTFNASLETALIVFMDEAFFVGDRRASDALKSLVTETTLTINQKNQPIRQIKSCHRFIAASNADHLKHTEVDDRRDFVLRVSPIWQGNHEKWKALYHQIDNGGVEAMVHDLLHADISNFNVRDKPQTRELLEQKLHSLNPVPSWWFDFLNGGYAEHVPDDPKSLSTGWTDFIPTDSIISYVTKHTGKKLYKEPTARDINQVFLKMCPVGERVQRKVNNIRRRGFALPTLEVCRDEFEQYIGGKIDWELTEDATDDKQEEDSEKHDKLF